jgi:(p)ppGpp synthase/HD superfamily hydrolase
MPQFALEETLLLCGCNYNFVKNLDFLNRDELERFLVQSGIRIDDYINTAMDMSTEIHSGIKREDNQSPFLETHIWPVTRDVIKHYLTVNRNITSVEIVSAILHDVMEDNDRILDLYKTKEYGFDAYLKYRFGNRVYEICMGLKIKPLENFPGDNDQQRQLTRFHDYCKGLSSADYDMKVIKLVDRANNMKFISNMPKVDGRLVNSKLKRYLREAEDFYLSFALLEASTKDLYQNLRESYESLKSLNMP